ncbi:hypothetical protein E4T44_07867 [Aureobasidium sp. EXF-8845]|nr:hypothetical protein E4T44_07867 [Aureobasidium sp. EXF-8845]KAI4845239.1 hypothetical protein E4T45_07809 [Aureobasidium sp. EXF-8846]
MPPTFSNHMEVTCPTAASDQPSTGKDQEMSEQQDLCHSPQQALSQEDRVSHDLETKGYSLLSWKQLCCSTGEAAKAKRKQYKSERQQKQQRCNAFHHRNKDRIIQQKSFEIQDLVTRMSEMKKNHKKEIDRITQQTDFYLKMSKERMQGLKEEHTAELEGRDQMQAILLVDLRELCQVYDEEISVAPLEPFRPYLPLLIAFLALPPDYSSIDNPPPITALKDSGPATPDLVIAKALITIRKTLASATTASTHLNPLLHIANTLHTSLATMKHGHKSHLWPRSSTAAALQAIHECVDRVTQFLTFHPHLHKSSFTSAISSTISSSTSSLFSPLPSSSAINANTLFRRAFAVADTLALEMCSLHFASGGRRARLLLFGDADATVEREVDTKDDLLDLQYWKNAFEGVRIEARIWMNEVGVVVFGDTVAWLEQEIMVLV